MTKKAGSLYLFLAVLLLGGEVVRTFWFRWDAPEWENERVLGLTLPRHDGPGFENLDLGETRGGEILAYDYGQAVRFYDSDQNRWSMDLYYLEYDPGNGRQLTDLFVHSPEVCLPASGSRLVRTLPPLVAEVGGRSVQARHLVFKHPISKLEFHVFKLVWLGRMEELGIKGDDNDFRMVRIKAAWGRLSRPPARMILTSLSGASSDQEARDLFRSTILSRCSLRKAPGP